MLQRRVARVLVVGIVTVVLPISLSGRASALTMEAAAPYALPFPPDGVAAADVDGDMKPDLAVVSPETGNAAVAIGDGGGGFVRTSGPFRTRAGSNALALADVNADGHADLITAGAASDTLAIRRGDGAGGFASPSTFDVGGTPQAIAVGDLNGDGRADIVSAQEGARTAAVLLRVSRGFTTPSGSPYRTGAAPHAIALADVDGDHDLDVVTVNPIAGTVGILLGNGSGHLTLASAFTVGIAPVAVAVADLDSDGDADIAAANAGSDDMTMMLGDGSGGFVQGRPVPAGDSPHSIGITDANDDRKLDVVISSADGLTVAFGDEAGGFSPATGSPYATTDPRGLVVRDFDGDGITDIAVARSNDVVVVRNASQRDLYAAPAALEFGSRSVSSVSSPLTVVVDGADGLATTVSAVEISGTDSGDYAVTDDTCTGRTLGDGYPTCAIDVTFTPSGTGPRSASIEIRAESPLSVGLSGIGIDTDPPDTTITGRPSDPTADDTPTFSFVSDEVDSSFECRLDDGAFEACEPPYTTSPLSVGSHTFDVRAIDGAGNVDLTPASFDFTVTLTDTQAPETTITGHPSAATNDRAPSFRFVSDEAGSVFACELDGSGFTTCTSPFTPSTSLDDAGHTFRVKAIDVAGNEDATPDTFTFTVDTKAPTTMISGPFDRIRRTVRFGFYVSEDATALRCAIDRAAFAPCNSTYRTPRLALGRHVLRVEAIDAAGNVESPPARKAFRIRRG